MLEDLVAFDVVLGDLNFDNCSSGMEVNFPSFIHSYAKFQGILEILHCIPLCFSEDKLEQQHALFTQYRDPCRLGPGEDKPWALGNDTLALALA